MQLKVGAFVFTGIVYSDVFESFGGCMRQCKWVGRYLQRSFGHLFSKLKSGAGMSRWGEPSNVIAAIAVVLSVVALASSVKSCSVSESALELANADYMDARALVLLGRVDDDRIALRPSDDSFVIQRVRYKFPSDFGGGFRSAVAPDFQVNVPSGLNVLKGIIAKSHSVDPGMALVSLESSLPVLVETRAIAKGRPILDRSLYALVYEFVLEPDGPEGVKVKLLAFHLADRLSGGDSGEVQLEAAWKEANRETSAAEIIR
ncbi:hypothetical protein [Stenotrophomonas sp. ZAC14A_NAIMI4_1]|uniref:hypothetical protein n=1 Tax=Stenotrophomonas sp. ZAC14A_NAIMI4_1 TaxID=2072412 RepID=UPI00131F07DC|nr:hypothetical protein [Stenotrophomonas sp. ZAC14A_NAIMI4_1]